MQKHLSPWREMWQERTADRRVEQAQYVTLLPFVLTLVGLGIALFGWTIAASLWQQRISLSTLYSVVAIAVVMRAAAELNLKWRWTSPR